MASKKVAPVIFITALILRLMNAPVIVAAIPHLTPLDDLYHWKRIAFSAAHFPEALEFDSDRGERGAFCPWPPLYDVACGAVARVFGMRAIIWIPPLVSAIAVLAATLIVWSAFGPRAAIAAGIALAASPFLVTESSVGDIDHHFLEWPLAFAILLASTRRSWIPLAIAMTAAMFIQTAMLVACGLAFVVAFLFTDGRAAGIAFGITTITITIYRLARPPNYPNSPWFLGWPHAALFAAAAVALLLRKWPAIAILASAAIALATGRSLLGGLHFFGGDPWLSTISEFQPVWKGNWEDWLSHAAGLSIGAILVFDLARRAIRDRDRLAGSIVVFALAYFAIAITSRRFEATAIPLLALAGAVDAAMILRRNAAMFAALAVALIPAIQLALWMMHPLPPISVEQQKWIRAAEFLRTRPPGRILAPWSMGHCLDVLGSHAVVIDNFGTMPDPDLFWRAEAALQSGNVTAMNVRYVVRPNAPGPRFRLVYSSGLNIWEYAGGG